MAIEALFPSSHLSLSTYIERARPGVVMSTRTAELSSEASTRILLSWEGSRHLKPWSAEHTRSPHRQDRSPRTARLGPCCISCRCRDMNGETVCLLNHLLDVSDPYRNVMMVFSQTLIGIYARAVRTVDAHTVEAGTFGKESHDRKSLSQACVSPRAPLNVCAESRTGCVRISSGCSDGWA